MLSTLVINLREAFITVSLPVSKPSADWSITVNTAIAIYLSRALLLLLKGVLEVSPSLYISHQGVAMVLTKGCAPGPLLLTLWDFHGLTITYLLYNVKIRHHRNNEMK
ncbi:hypothetical protein E2C01_089182 [Portunus trituberculatus]|uniref:Uncharacterized protein n=1 Tax=Portunus trituberculatus TaxID=210409 RepID=A0A5B7J839_PORTR|nr:hypothetical protein [Portunus trituberculatus]